MLLRVPLRTGLALTLLLAGGAEEAFGQAVGRGNASIQVSVGLTVPTQLNMRRANEAEVVAWHGDTLHITLGVEVAANQDWTLKLLTTEGLAAANARIMVQDFAGNWRPIGANAMPVTVVEDHGPCNFTPFVLQVRVVGVTARQALRTLTFDLAPHIR